MFFKNTKIHHLKDDVKLLLLILFCDDVIFLYNNN